MEIRQAVHPEQAKTFDTEQLRGSFLIRELFTPGKIRMVYSYYDPDRQAAAGGPTFHVK